MQHLGEVKLRTLIGGLALKWHLGWTGRLNVAMVAWQSHAPGTFELPHPSWRNTGWLKRNPFFDIEVVPALRVTVLKDLSYD